MKYNKVHRYFFESLRCSPILFDFIFLTLYSISNNQNYLKLLLIKFLLVPINFLLKEMCRYIFKKFGILKNKGYYLPILGRGDRPNGAKNCGLFNECTNRLSKSHGFPSGHAQSAGSIFILMSVFIKNEDHQMILFVYTVIMSLARVYENCHTIEQVIAGYLIGVYLTKYSLNYLKINTI